MSPTFPIQRPRLHSRVSTWCWWRGSPSPGQTPDNPPHPAQSSSFLVHGHLPCPALCLASRASQAPSSRAGGKGEPHRQIGEGRCFGGRGGSVCGTPQGPLTLPFPLGLQPPRQASLPSPKGLGSGSHSQDSWSRPQGDSLPVTEGVCGPHWEPAPPLPPTHPAHSETQRQTLKS